MSSTASAFASCNVMNARVPSSETAMYSGSSCWTNDRPGIGAWTPAVRNSEARDSNASKLAFRSVAFSAPCERSMTEIDPAGSSAPSSLGSASLATSSVLPSGVNVSMSGPKPTLIAPICFIARSKNRTSPCTSFDFGIQHIATRFPYVATLVIPNCRVIEIRKGFAWSEMSTIESPCAEFVT